MSASEPPLTSSRKNADFASTHWSLVFDAGRSSSPQCERALAELCETYWYPLYAFVRRQGHDAPDAQDLTQGFFLRLLEKRDFAGVDRAKGRFRSFLLASVKHYLINEWDKARAAKRGGGRAKLSLEVSAAESRYALEPSHHRTAEAAFDREWALTLLEEVRRRLAEEHDTDSRRNQYEQLQIYLTGEPTSLSYRETGKKLGMAEGTVKVAVHRLRGRFRELLREQISQTVASDDDVDDEIRKLFEALRG